MPDCPDVRPRAAALGSSVAAAFGRGAGRVGGRMWLKLLLAYLLILGSMLWFMYRFGNAQHPSVLPSSESSPR